MFEGNPNRNKPEVLRNMPRVGERILLAKKEIRGDKASEIQAGETFSGVLTTPIEIGAQIVLDNGMRTSPVRNISHQGEQVLIQTATSVYELNAPSQGLYINSPIGRVELPSDARPAALTSGSAPPFEVKIPSTKEVVKVLINRDALKDVLIRTNGSVLHINGSRYIVLARVGNAQLPFYRSSNGTDGKRKGEWYPFFGHTGSWMIKGDVDARGDMQYHSAITDVQRLLNENLILPDPHFWNRKLQMTNSSGDVLYSLAHEIPVDDFLDSSDYKESEKDWEAERDYVERVTGYAPQMLRNYHPRDNDSQKASLTKEWISDITRGVEEAQQK